MRRIDLAAITLEAWQRLDERQRQRFAEMFLRAALRPGGPELRRWLRRRVRTAPLAAPVDPAAFAISDADIALLMRAAREPPGETPPGRTGTMAARTPP